MTVALIDDRILGSMLRGQTPPSVRRRTVATTGYWYVRLCQAVLGASVRPGVLSGPFAEFSPLHRDRALRAVLQLPDHITLLSLRELAPSIGQLRTRHSLNILGMEVLAAAIALGAEVFLSSASPRLQAALATEHRKFRLLT